MINTYSDFVKSLALDIKKGKEVSFLLGSAVSCSIDGKGVPSVSGMNEILRQYMIGLDIYDEFEVESVGLSEVEKYQNGFAYLLKVGDQEDVKEIMSLAMNNVRNGDDWHITKTLSDLSNLFNETDVNVNSILTTNFDPLIEEALSKIGRECNIHNLIIDQPIGTVRSYSGGTIPVVHLHGVWDGDTMHTQTQLTTLRKKIETSIKSILDVSKLYVIGYSGWDDVFLQALKDIVHDFKPSYNVRWAFYDSSVDDIIKENKKLIDILQPALTNARFQGYAGVDCNNFFEDVILEVSKKKGVAQFKVGKSGLISKKKDKSLSLTTYSLSFEPAHDCIRFVEQKKAIDYLNNERSFELVAGWGYGKSGFLYSFLHDEFNDCVYFYTDINGLDSIEGITNKIKQDIGVDITFFFSNIQVGKRILIIDNIPKLSHQTRVFLQELASLTADYNSSVQIIFVSNSYNNICKSVVNLAPLSVDDIKEYIRFGGDVGDIKREELDKLYEISNGIPLKLDKVKEYNGLMSFGEVLEAGKIVLPEESLSSEIPHSLSKLVKEIKSDNKKLYKLLCIFSILDCGEKLANIRSHYSFYDFQFEDFAKLERLGLIYTLRKSKDKILRISPVINDFIKQSMSSNEKYELIEKSLELCLGGGWMSGDVNVSPVIKMMLKNPEFYPGNAHSVIDLYFSLIDINVFDREVKALIHASIGYCMYLKNACYYKELVAFSRMVYSNIRHLNVNDKYRVSHYLACGLRMIDEVEQCVELLEPMCDEYLKESFCQKSYYYQMLENIMMACGYNDEEKSRKYALALKKQAAKSSGFYINAESYLAEGLSEKSKIKKLISLEKKSRSNGYNVLANNISIRLQQFLSGESFKYLDKVINDENGVYTKARALLLKYEGLMERGAIDKIDLSALRELRGVYDYLFSQRLDDLFNRCTEVLWQLMKSYGDVDGLYYLFKRGSVIWRVTSLYDKELKYAQDLNDQNFVQISVLDDAEYLVVRLNFLIVKMKKDSYLIDSGLSDDASTRMHFSE
ncbi:SIR2 family protein [Serratia marcescens]|nr:SIR2 family protein [Serratia marcescens]MBH2671424.1 SIR2 family protein [Serratia marcescens]